MTSNFWKVIWKTQEGKKLLKKFPGESPKDSGAIAFGKKLQERGLLDVSIVSGLRAYGPPIAKRTSPRYGMIWCPYCLKWQEFKEFALRLHGLKIPSALRCPVCTISIRDGFVLKYNYVLLGKMAERKKTKVPSVRTIKKRRYAHG